MQTRTSSAFKLIYWPGMPGRGEFVRLAFEATGTPYEDTGLADNIKEIEHIIDSERQVKEGDAHFAVPVLQHGDFRIGQTAAILSYIGPIIGFAPKDEQGRAKVNQLQLTISDLTSEAHDTHHPISVSDYYENQKDEALRRARDFVDNRIPKFLDYFERQITLNKNEPWLYGNSITYADTSLFQVVDGLLFAFPKCMEEQKKKIPKVLALYDAVKNHEKISKYLASERRQKYSNGIFRYYPELDVPKSQRENNK